MTTQSRLRRVLKSGLLVAASLAVALSMGEAMSRVVLNPVDFLRPELVEDEVLRLSITPGSGGHDAWGFRNEAVPAAADIVAIGDSMTYGASAPAHESWPAALENSSGLRVYNMGLGGYGPVQYFHLLHTKATLLRPKAVVVGFYLGNDLRDTYDMVSRFEFWSQLQTPEFPATDVPSEVTRPPLPAHQRIREWLSERSVVYNVLVHSFLGEFARFTEAEMIAAGVESYRHVEYAGSSGFSTWFTPGERLVALDLDDPRIEAGLEISLDLFLRMHAHAAERNIHFLVVLIPLKESVYAPLVAEDAKLGADEAIRSVIAAEQSVAEIAVTFFRENGIPYLDVRPELQRHVETSRLYPSNFDGHPNRNGYRLIAEAVADRLAKTGAFQ